MLWTAAWSWCFLSGMTGSATCCGLTLGRGTSQSQVPSADLVRIPREHQQRCGRGTAVRRLSTTTSCTGRSGPPTRQETTLSQKMPSSARGHQRQVLLLCPHRNQIRAQTRAQIQAQILLRLHRPQAMEMPGPSAVARPTMPGLSAMTNVHAFRTENTIVSALHLKEVIRAVGRSPKSLSEQPSQQV